MCRNMVKSAANPISPNVQKHGKEYCQSVQPKCAEMCRNTVKSSEPRWPSSLRCWFANATPRETGFRIPPLPRAEFAGSRWSDIIGSSLQGRGEDSATWMPNITKHLGLLELRQMGERMRLEEDVSLSESLDPLRAARDEVYAVDPKLAWGGN